MIVILTGMFIAAVILMLQLPENVKFGDAVGIAGKMGKLNVVDFEFDLSNRYNFWSGMLGGYSCSCPTSAPTSRRCSAISAANRLTESRLGLLFNGILRCPCSFWCSLSGILVFVFLRTAAHPLQHRIWRSWKAPFERRLENLQAQQHPLSGTTAESEYLIKKPSARTMRRRLTESQQRLQELIRPRTMRFLQKWMRSSCKVTGRQTGRPGLRLYHL